MDLFKKLKFWRGVGQVLNTGIGSFVIHTFGQQVNWLASKAISTDNNNIPWTPFTKPLAESCLALVSTAGFYLDGDEPFDVDSVRGDAGFRIIPSDADKEKLKIAHTHYPLVRVNDDINVLFPVDRLHELSEAGVVGKLSRHFYSFGFGGNLTKEFIDRPDGSAHQLVKKLKNDKVDCVVMVPAWPLCNRAGGLITRVIEASGIPTVSLSINRQISDKLLAPRAAFVKFPHGSSFGEPHNRLQQMTILRELLLLLQTAQEPGILMNLPYQWKRSVYDDVNWNSFIAGQVWTYISDF